MAPTGYLHGKVSSRADRRIGDHVEKYRLGDVLGAGAGFRVAQHPDTVLAPDVAFVRADRIPADTTSQAFLDLAPDLVVEVISPSDRAGAVAEKAAR